MAPLLPRDADLVVVFVSYRLAPTELTADQRNRILSVLQEAQHAS